MSLGFLLRYGLVVNLVLFGMLASGRVFSASINDNSHVVSKINRSTSVDDSLDVIGKTNISASQSQQRVDKLALETQRLLEQYQSIILNTEYQDAYNAQLQQLQHNQSAQITSLKRQLNDINITQMRIMPLMLSMADALEKFIVLDLPFQQTKRINGIVQLKQHLRNPALSAPNKYRLVLEAYQIESDYGRTLHAYRDKLQQGGVDISVQFLRVGRIGLYYQSLDGRRSGIWDKTTGNWQRLPSHMNANIKQAVRVADNRVAPELLNLPVKGITSADVLTLGGEHAIN
jgi:hypothetical protein